MTERPFSQACENNKAPILAVLQRYLTSVDQVLEIGSGTGQHAVHFAAQLPQLIWQCSDQAEYLDGINAWLDWAQLPNTPPPLLLDVQQPWPVATVPAIFSANTLHIMSWELVCQFIPRAASMLVHGGWLLIYGPFNYGGTYTSDSNRQFDVWLKTRDPMSGIRDQEAVNQLAQEAGLLLQADHAMPANNRLLVWQKRQ